MPALGITKMGERFYLPKIGRWTQQDPLNQPLDPRQGNRYVYAGADPVNIADPSGEYWLWYGARALYRRWLSEKSPPRFLLAECPQGFVPTEDGDCIVNKF